MSEDRFKVVKASELKGRGAEANPLRVSAGARRRVQPYQGLLAAFSKVPQSKAEVAVLGEALTPVLWQGEQWAVTEYGIEARDGRYSIPAKRLSEVDGSHTWVHQMAEKSWVDVREFALTYAIACAVHEVEFK